MVCECGCEAVLRGKQKRFASEACKTRWWSWVRQQGADAVKKERGKIHRASLANSARMRDLLALLRMGPKTNLDIRDTLNSGAPGTDISELRHNGFDIRAQFIRSTEQGRKIYLYTLVEESAA